jgi:aryl-alcohol dehydrogenase-like predicted oxidoreductase
MHSTTTIPGTDIEVSREALGTWAFSGDPNWGPQDDKESIRAVHAALDSGIFTIDTAEAYGEEGYAESVLGEALEGRRSQAVIATKVWKNRRTKEEIIRACEASLKRLRTDFVELYQIHWPSKDREFEEQVEGLERLKESGKIRSYGVCNFGPLDLSDFQATAERLGASVPLATNQIAYNLLWRSVEDELLPACEAAGIGVLAYSPIAQGLLTGKYHSADEVPPGRARTKHFSAEREQARHGMAGHEELTFRTVDRIREISAQTGLAMGDLALGWLLAKDEVTSVLVGGRNADQVKRNANALHVQIPSEVLAELDTATQELKDALAGQLELWSNRMR